eukprot:COSAG06_NODE_5660_length_3336_cov_3.981464_1_plen_35_part_00
MIVYIYKWLKNAVFRRFDRALVKKMVREKRHSIL